MSSPPRSRREMNPISNKKPRLDDGRTEVRDEVEGCRETATFPTLSVDISPNDLSQQLLMEFCKSEAFKEVFEEILRESEAFKELRGRMDSLSGRMDSLTGAFQPALSFASFETAIFEFVLTAIPDAAKEKHENAIKQTAQKLGRVVLLTLLSSETNSSSIQYEGFTEKANLTNNEKNTLILKVLQGLCEYIKSESKETIENFETFSDQPMLQNGGGLSSAFFPSPPSTSGDGLMYKDKKARNKAYRTALKTAATDNPRGNIKDAITAVMTEITALGISVEDESSKKEALIHMLEWILKN